MRSAVTNEIVRSAAVTNAVTGALMFIPGANYPVMTVAQAGMALRLASIHGYKIAPERVYEVAGVAVAGLVFRGAAARYDATPSKVCVSHQGWRWWPWERLPWVLP